MAQVLSLNGTASMTGHPSDCPSATQANSACFAVDPTEVDPTQASYSGAFASASANTSVAVTQACSGSSYSCTSSNGILVYGQGAGNTTVTVSGGSGATGTFPVTVTQTNATIALQNLPNAAIEQIYYQLSNGSAGSFMANVTATSANATVTLYNLALPVNAVYSTLQAQVYDSNGNELGVETLSNVSIPSGTTNVESFTVSPTTK